jgi:CubicO group peptidase (beta-lactamase class C family)
MTVAHDCAGRKRRKNVAEGKTVKCDAAAIDAIFASLDQGHLPGAAVAIAIDGTPVYRKGFGLASIELPVTLSPSMRLRIGSTTKHFVSFAYLLLCEEGRAGIDDELGKYLPDLHEASRRVTMRQLMGHTSGIRDIAAITMFMHGTGIPVTEQEMLAYYKTIGDVDFAPDTGWSYNNGGYMLLSAVIEKITGDSLDSFLRERVFEPVGMNDTLLRRWDSDFVPNSATLHMLDPGGKYVKQYMGMEISGMGGIASTMDDMLRWLRHMDRPIVGSDETWKLMTTPRVLANGQSTGYGMGLILQTYRGVETISHSGGVMGGNSQMIKVPSAKLDISVAANRADVNSMLLANQIIDACIEGLEPLPEVEFEKRSGYFLSARTGRAIELVAQDDQQFMSVDGSPAFPLRPDGKGGLELPSPFDFMRLGVTPTGTGLRYSDFGNEDELDAVEKNADISIGTLPGVFRSEAISTTAEIFEDTDGPRVRFSGKYGTHLFKLEPVTSRVWKFGSLGIFPALAGTLTFDEDAGGFTLNAMRLTGLRFVRD